MEKSYYMNAAAAQHLKFGTTMPIPWNGGNLVNAELNSNSSSYMDQYYAHLESTLSSIASSAAAAPTASLPSGDDAFVLRELIAKQLGGGAVGSPPNPRLPPILDHAGSLGNSPLPPVPSVACDPGFAERAAKFSCFGSRSFNGRTVLDGAELSNRSDHLLSGNAKLSRVASSPALRHGGSPFEAANNGVLMGSSDKKSSSNEESSVSTGSKKRKAASRVKSSSKPNEGEDEGGLKRTKQTENNNKSAKTGPTNDEKDQKQKANQKPQEPPKDYIHVRARRGQATDSHSLAERVRREKISERMKLLQDLVPGCNKVTGKALMLDEIINYVQSLQRQVEFLSMKLATVNPAMEVNVNNILSKNVFQENGTLQQQMYPMDSDASSTAFYHHQLRNNANASVDPTGIQFPSLTEFNEFPAFGEDDLQSIVHMGFPQNSVDFPVTDQTNDVKIEL